MSVRAITKEGFDADLTPRSVADCGPAPQLQWLKIASLVVDPTYQREITKQGRKNVRRIAEEFDWRRFSPVIVAPVAGGLYAIVDGQHRTTAAAIVGHEAVPCQVIMAEPGQQAEAFRAINSAVTRITTLAMHKAAVAAGHADAVSVERAAAEAGVKVLAYPVALLRQEPCETLAIGSLKAALAEYGHDSVVLGLRSVAQTKNAVRGGLSATIVTAICAAAAEWLRRGRDAEQFVSEIGSIILIREADKATRGRAIGQSAAAALLVRLRSRLALDMTAWKGAA